MAANVGGALDGDEDLGSRDQEAEVKRRRGLTKRQTKIICQYFAREFLSDFLLRWSAEGKWKRIEAGRPLTRSGRPYREYSAEYGLHYYPTPLGRRNCNIPASILYEQLYGL